MDEPKQEFLPTVQAIGEQGLLKIVQSFCPSDLIGDDGASLTTQPGRSLIVTTDILVNGVHFSDQTASPEDAGWRAAAANLSDLAAMGATPIGITVGLGLPGDVPVAWVEGLYRGLTACLSQYKSAIVGGDLCRSSVITVAITALGEAEPNRIMHRSAAQPGDAIVVTGFHGASRAGLELLLHPESGRSLSVNDRAYLIQAHQRPKPRLDAIELLWRLRQGVEPQRRRDAEEVKEVQEGIQAIAAPYSTVIASPASPTPLPLTHVAGMDSSDGLADAVIQICRASRVGARIERNQIPVPPTLTKWVGAEQALEWALYGGEDFELVLCLPLGWAQILVEQLSGSAAIVGMVTTTQDILLVDATEKRPDQPLTLERGFQHFTG